MDTKDRLYRIIYAITLVAVVILGLASRRYAAYLPDFAAKGAGDALYATMTYFLARLFRPRAPLWKAFAGALLFCYLVEFSQIYHAPWIDRIRQTLPGRLILGTTFVWSDLICYIIGVMLGVAMDALIPILRKTFAGHTR